MREDPPWGGIYLNHVYGLNDTGGEHAGGASIAERLRCGPYAGGRLWLLVVSHLLGLLPCSAEDLKSQEPELQRDVRQSGRE